MGLTLGIGLGLYFGSGGGVAPAPALRQVATRAQVPGVQSGGSQKVLSKSHHDCMDTITRLKLGAGNWYADPSVGSIEVNAGGPCTVTMGIEYPAGVVYSAAPFVLADGDTGECGWIDVNIPAGARFLAWQRKVWTGSGKAVYSSVWADDQGADGVDRMIIGPGGDAFNFGDAITSTATGFGSAPLYIIAETTKNAAIIYGDSNDFGSLDTYDYVGLYGPIARLLGSRMGFINCGRGSESTQHFITGHAKRAALAQYASHVYVGHGTNDLGASLPAATTIANLVTIAGYFPGKTLLSMTETPRTTGAWTLPDGSDQTVYANEAERILIQNWKRGGGTPFAQVYEYADRIETSRNSGKWKAPGYSTDGIHGSRTAALESLNMGVDLDLLGPKIWLLSAGVWRDYYNWVDTDTWKDS